MSTTSATKKIVFGDVGHLIAFGFGVGLIPYIPGTVGTLLALPLYYATVVLGIGGQCVLMVVLFIVGALLSHRVNKRLNRLDDGGIVIDEIVAFYMLLIIIPPQPLWQLAAFVVFRFFDVVKPPPIRWLDRHIKNGWGVMIDDIAAAIMSVILLFIAAQMI